MLVEIPNLLNRHFKKHLIWRHWCFGFLQNHPKVWQKDSQLWITADISRIPRKTRKLINMNQDNLQTLPSRRHCKTEKRRNKWWWWNLGKLSSWKALLHLNPNQKCKEANFAAKQFSKSHVVSFLFCLYFDLKGYLRRKIEPLFSVVVRHLAGLESLPTCSTVNVFCPFETSFLALSPAPKRVFCSPLIKSTMADIVIETTVKVCSVAVIVSFFGRMILGFDSQLWQPVPLTYYWFVYCLACFWHSRWLR